ncbi:PEP-CTERM sorting domain-containing protein [Amantichitinum ursilacus]|uniref:PEP-CTERM motif protein n=1 Tax=Amantichitinum ursilacus TaxID=857265 RepID=A0A0N1JRH0_9NEIS|nr:PEP-CTERM sorting domain-containing protein [Amantichitinum ursilacus]KPC49661.1 PEP-CTERM motif protein [Amantichitinum ursilacus]
MKNTLKRTLLTTLLGISAAAAQAGVLSLDHYNNPGPFGGPEYLYEGLGFSPYNSGTGYASADYYSDYTINIVSHRGVFEINAVALATFQNFETNPSGPYAITDVTLTGYLGNQAVGTTAFHLAQTDGVYRWYSANINWLVDRISLVGDGQDLLQTYTLNALDISPIPEPETWALLGVGAVALAARHGRKVRAHTVS